MAAAVDGPHQRRRLALAVVLLVGVPVLCAHVGLAERALHAALIHKRRQCDVVEAEPLRLHSVEDAADARRRLAERLGLVERPCALGGL